MTRLQASFAAILRTLQPTDRYKHNANLLLMGEIANLILSAELSYREGDHDLAFSGLLEAVEKFDALPYDEPHGWLMSPRQVGRGRGQG